MRRPHVEWPGSVLPSLLAAFTTWVALWAWRGFVADPSGYLDPALASVLLVAVTGVALRAFRVPSVLVVLVQVAVVTLWLTHLWAPEEALGGWLPTAASLEACLSLLGQGAAAAQNYAAPVPTNVPQIYSVLVATGTVVALLVDFLANGLRRVPVAGLPLLAVYTAPVSILDEGVAWWVFAAGAAGFLAMIATDEGHRLEQWGRQVPRRGAVVDTSGGMVASTSLRGSARRIGLTATALAVVSPLVIPTFSGNFLPGNGPGGDGGGDAVSISNPLVNLRRDLVRGKDVDLLRIRTDNADPTYLRISVLDTFTGLAWKPSDREIPPEQKADGLLPRPPGLDSVVPRRQVDYEISIEEAFDSTWLPAPYPATSIDVPGDWRYDEDTLDFISAVDGQDTAGLEYTLSALEPDFDGAELVDAAPAPESIFTPYTELPDDMPDTVATLARRATQGLSSRYEKAVRLQDWFRSDGGFTYSLDPAPGTGTDDLEAFLEERVGYCEQFAASMALMGRTLGIPSRVAVGFLEPVKDGDEYVYSAWDLHAWPEMYFEGAGWVRFEPTPNDRAPSVPGYTTGNFQAPEPADLPSSAAPSANPNNPNEERLRGDEVAGASDEQGGGGGAVGRRLPLVLVLVALLFVPWLARTAVRRRRWALATTPREAAEAGWRELRDVNLDLRLPWDDSVTLRTRARGVATAFGRTGEEQREGFVRGGVRGADANPEAAAALDRLVTDVERARYSRGTDNERGRTLEAVRADVETCAEALKAGTVKKWRRAAAWLPASLVRNGAWRSVLPGNAPKEVALPEGGVDRAV
jgi:transglutaminase-like putative cysteine protease